MKRPSDRHTVARQTDVQLQIMDRLCSAPRYIEMNDQIKTTLALAKTLQNHRDRIDLMHRLGHFFAVKHYQPSCTVLT